MKILLLRTWLRNIGNGFIDKGAKVILKRAYPDADIIEVSGFPFLAGVEKELGEFSEIYSTLGGVGDKWKQRRLDSNDVASNVFSIVDALDDIDFAVLPGCVLYEFALRPYSPVIESLKRRDIPVLLLGAGGGDYEQQTCRFVRKWIRRVEPDGLITRDSVAFSTYSDLFNFAVDGIDCAFFINEWYTPPETSDQFFASTFDKIDEPTIHAEKTVRPMHNPFGDSKPFAGIVDYVYSKTSQRGFFEKENVFLSDRIKDYLFIYSNAMETHSDRIHACVPALAYGNSARFYYDTPRGKLFESVLESDIRNKVVSLGDVDINNKKQRQVDAVREFVESV